jgi:23S rRNA pseudouridine1911/1915/1917 synthase
MNLPVLFEDEHILVINKPPGLVVNQADTVAEHTVQSWFSAYMADQPRLTAEQWQPMIPDDYDTEFGSPQEIFDERQGLVHRLDKNTSGVLVLAKHPGSLLLLLKQFKERQTTKKYRALVHGKFQVPEATISEPVGRASRDRKLFAVRPDGRSAVTRYQVVKEYVDVALDSIAAAQQLKLTEVRRRFSIYQGFSEVLCWPQTGRTHQIRVHMAHLKHPIVGDITYVGRKRQVLDPWWCPRHFLHAEELCLHHPVTNELVTFHAPLSPDLQSVLALLQ